MSDVIDNFSGENAFLSNNYFVTQKSKVEYIDPDTGDVETTFDNFPTLTHALECQKTMNRQIQNDIKDELDYTKIGSITKEMKIREGFALNRTTIMKHLLEDKFNQHLDLKILLLNTGNAEIVCKEIDNFWGVQDKKGENNLGKLLMEVRKDIFEKEGSAQNIFRSFLIKSNLGSIIDIVCKDE